MPNWIEGNLKIRGDYDKVKKFLLEGIQGYEVGPKPNFESIPQEKDKFMGIDEYDDEFSISYWDSPHITGTYRAFVNAGSVYCYRREDGSTTAVLPIRQAWSFKPSDFKELSDEYDLDFRLQGWECGMQFGQDITIVRGEEVVEDVLKYDDWDWDCPMPNMGG